MKTAAILSLFSMIWCFAALVKIAGCLSRKEPYTFRQWDGGLMLRGQTMGRVGSMIFGAFCLACGIGAAYLFARTQGAHL